MGNSTTKLRGTISDDFIDALKASAFHQFYKDHKNELILCLRCNEIHVYYACDRIAKIEFAAKTLSFKMNEYYFTGVSNSNEKSYKAEEIIANYDTIKANSDKKATAEKKAQQQLFINNNANPNSNWFCVDVEYAKAYANQTEKDADKEDGHGRVDIVAISKKPPHTIACFELKYGKVAFGGKSGLKAHIAYFYKFKSKGYCKAQLKIEVAKIINALCRLGEPIPKELCGIEASSISDEPKFFLAVLNNNAEKQNATTPLQTCCGYLFSSANPKYAKHKSKRQAKVPIEKMSYGDITEAANTNLSVEFLFSAEKLPITISDIIDDEKWVRL